MTSDDTVAGIILVFGLVVGVAIGASSTYAYGKADAIRAGVGQHNPQTGYFEWIPRAVTAE